MLNYLLPERASPFRKSTPSTLFSAICAAGVILALAACGQADPPSAEPASASPSVAASGNDDAADPATASDVKAKAPPRTASTSATSLATSTATSTATSASTSPAKLAAVSPIVNLSRGVWVDLTHAQVDRTAPSVEPATATRSRASNPARSSTTNNTDTDDTTDSDSADPDSHEHAGTYIDAPIQFTPTGRAVAQMPIDTLIGMASIVDLTEQCEDADHAISISDIEAWEQRSNSKIDGMIVIIKTGYYRFWGDNRKYFGSARRDQRGALTKARFPSLAPETAQWLASVRKIRSIGIDVTSVDMPRATKAHRIFAEYSIPVFENVGYLSKLGKANHVLIAALPQKTRHVSGGPLRIVAFVAKPAATTSTPDAVKKLPVKKRQAPPQ
ncbi:hypothetical protein BH09PSE5_BH09PSE5_24910 [soil metagenome]